MNLDGLRLNIADHLCRIEDMIPFPNKITLLVRNPANPRSSIVVTVDDPDKIIEAIQRLRMDENSTTIRGSEPDGNWDKDE